MDDNSSVLTEYDLLEKKVKEAQMYAVLLRVGGYKGEAYICPHCNFWGFEECPRHPPIIKNNNKK